MDEAEEIADSKEVKTKRKIYKIRLLFVIVVLVVFAFFAFVTNRAEYLKIREINPSYVSIFKTNFKMKLLVFGTAFFTTYIIVYINNLIIKKGLKKFFDEENKPLPKLLNKTICLTIALIVGGLSLKNIYEKFLVFKNATSFGITDPIFNIDIGFYMFILPFLKTLIMFLLVFSLFMILYTAIYYTVSINKYLENGVEVEKLKKSNLVKQVKFWAIMFAIFMACFLIVSSQDILTGDMIKIKDKAGTMLTGAGIADSFIKLWGYRIFGVIVLIASINIIRNATSAKFRKCISAFSIIPIYLVVMFGVLIYFQEIYVGSSELDKEKEYIGYNINATKVAFGIDIDQNTITNYDTVTYENLNGNIEVIDNIPVFNSETINKTIEDSQDNSTYYSYKSTNYGIYNDKLISITPREILNDSNRSYNNKTFEYTHGYSVVVTDPNKIDKNGYVSTIQSSINESNSNDLLKIKEPRIYFGLQTNSEIIVNSKYGAEFDYPIDMLENEEYEYEGSAGETLGFLDRVALGLDTGNSRIILSRYLDDSSKIITTRNILQRCKLLLPYIEYDENPYLVVNSEGELIWVIDGYTTSKNYPYSQKISITKSNGMKQKINYIRNSVKVLVNAYTGDTEFYITDRNDPIIMMYQKLYPDLFMPEGAEIDSSIEENLLYPQYLFDVQTSVIRTYHDISEDMLYRADDVWSEATIDSENLIGSKYTMLRTPEMEEANLGIVSVYTKQGKESLNSYLVGSYKDGTPKLELYKFSSESSIIGVPQLNTLIEEDEIISDELKKLDAFGVKVVKDIIIVPIGNSLLYVEPIYQERLNETEENRILKKIIVASGNKVAMGDNLSAALENLLSDKNSVELEYIDMEDENQVIESIIEANQNLKESVDSGDLEMIGKDMESLMLLINQLETIREEIEED